MDSSLLHEDRLFPAEKVTRQLARHFYSFIKNAAIISPHGHTDPRWFAENEQFTDPVSLLITPDHYILRMLYSQGMSLDALGVIPKEGLYEQDKRKIWHYFAKSFYLFRATPSSLWLKYVFHNIFQIQKPFTVEHADYYFDEICALLKKHDYSPRSLFIKFNIDVLATTDHATDTLTHHQKIQQEFHKKIIPTYRPDGVIDPEHEDFFTNLNRLGELTNEDVNTWQGYLNAHILRRQYFKKYGAVATDHGHPNARALALSKREAEKLFNKIRSKKFTEQDADDFRAHMLWQMAAMSVSDQLVMQLHPGCYRNHNPQLFKKFGRDKGADIPISIEYTKSIKPLLDAFGNDKSFRVILYTLDESVYSHELAVLAGHYPSVMLGPAWWFHDSPEGLLRHRKHTIETAGFYNITGFVDDTRAFLSIPARHDLARRTDARLLAELVAEHRLTEEEAIDTLIALTTTHAKASFRL